MYCCSKYFQTQGSLDLEWGERIFRSEFGPTAAKDRRRTTLCLVGFPDTLKRLPATPPFIELFCQKPAHTQSLQSIFANFSLYSLYIQHCKKHIITSKCYRVRQNSSLSIEKAKKLGKKSKITLFFFPLKFLSLGLELDGQWRDVKCRSCLGLEIWTIYPDLSLVFVLSTMV